MSSLLEGIEVGESGGKKSKSSGGGVNPKVIKGAIAGVLFLIAGVVLGIYFGVIPSPLGAETPRNSAGEEIVYTPPTQAEVEQEVERLKRAEEEFIKSGGSVGGA